MKSTRIETGKTGERVGLTYLKCQGYKILEVNYKTPLGEIDVIARHKGFIVFIEIKTRHGVAFGRPEDAVHGRKQQKIIQNAQCYMKSKGLNERPARFDVLAVILQEGETPHFSLFEAAFEVI